jgi:hypothetical protein
MHEWRVGICLCLVAAICGVAIAKPIVVTGSIKDRGDKSLVEGVSIQIADKHNRDLAKGNSDGSGRFSIDLLEFTGSHVRCKFSSPLYESADLLFEVKDGKVDCSIQLPKAKGIRFDKLFVDEKPDQTSVLRSRLMNDAGVSQTVDRFEVAAIWRSERRCHDPLPLATYEVAIDIPFRSSVKIRDGVQNTDLTIKDVKFRAVKDPCKSTCLRFSFQPALKLGAGEERSIQLEISKLEISKKSNPPGISMPQGTDYAFQLRATYATRQETTESAGSPLLDSLKRDPDCKLQQ